MIFGRHINRYYGKYAILLLIGLISLFTVDMLQLQIPNIYQMVINGIDKGYVVVDGVQMPFDMEFMLEKICMPMVGIIIAICIGRFLWRVTIFGSAIFTERDIRGRMFAHSKELSREYYQVNKAGDIMSLYTNDLDTVQECFGLGFMEFFDALILGTMAIIKMWQMDHILTILSLIPMGFLFAAASVVGSYMMKKWDYRQACFSKLSDFAQESFSGIAVIKAFVKEAKELMAFKAINTENEKANIDFAKASVLLRVLVIFFVESVVCVILGYGGFLVHQGMFNAGQLMEFIGYFSAIVWPVMAISELIDLSSRGRASLKRISELLDRKIDVVDRAGAREVKGIKGKIEMRHLTFRYPDKDVDALRDVSFTINAGERIGLVGKTGCGKTTLVDLILRTYNVPDGSLFIDDHDVNDITIHSVREASAYVPQDNFLFSDTIENNISFGVSDSDDTSIRQSARLADVEDNIMEFAEGFATMLGERGVTVSGGQKQRISIARALLKDAPILILDDSVSAVDTKTEKTILENLYETRRGKTTILIAHRVSTIKRMDRILFMEDGRIVDFATHDELYENNSEYRKMVDLQQLDEEEENHNA